MKNPPVAWVVLTLACVFIGSIWVLAWHNSPWPTVGWIAGPIVMSIPLWVGIAALIRKRQ